MLAQQFHEAAAAVRTTAQLDMIARQLWVAHGEGHLADADAEALSRGFAGSPSGFRPSGCWWRASGASRRRQRAP